MPAIYEYFGIIFYFFSHEHEPIHVHADYNGQETVFEIIYNDGKLQTIKRRSVKGKKALPIAQMKDAESFVERYHKEITQKWMDFHILNKAVKKVRITKKIR